MDYSPPGSSIHGISQARTLEQVAISFSGDLADPGMGPESFEVAGGFFAIELPGKLIVDSRCFQNVRVRVLHPPKSDLGGGQFPHSKQFSDIN